MRFSLFRKLNINPQFIKNFDHLLRPKICPFFILKLCFEPSSSKSFLQNVREDCVLFNSKADKVRDLQSYNKKSHSFVEANRVLFPSPHDAALSFKRLCQQ